MRLLSMLALLLASQSIQAWEIQNVQVQRDEKEFAIQAAMVIDAPPELVRAALTDFENLDQLLKGVKESRQLPRTEDSDPIQVYTKRRSCFLLFCFNSEVVEVVTYPQNGVIVSTIVPDQSDFKSGFMRWQITPTPNGTLMVYTAEMEPEFWIPKAVGSVAIKRSMNKELKNLAKVLERRAQENRAG